VAVTCRVLIVLSAYTRSHHNTQLNTQVATFNETCTAARLYHDDDRINRSHRRAGGGAERVVRAGCGRSERRAATEPALRRRSWFGAFTFQRITCAQAPKPYPSPSHSQLSEPAVLAHHPIEGLARLEL
jgi:hypothetical protein